MDLWSPVDLVSGGTETRNISSSSSVCNISNTFAAPNSKANLEKKDKKLSHFNFSSSNYNVSKTMDDFANRLVMSDCKQSHFNLKPPPIAHTSSLSKSVTTSKKSTNDEEKNFSKTKLAEFGEGLTENIKKFGLSKHDTYSSSFTPSSSSSFFSPYLFPFSKFSPHSVSPASKLIKYDNPIINCDKFNSSLMVKSVVSSALPETDMPLNLCVKRPSLSHSESKSQDNHQSTILNVSSNPNTLCFKSESSENHNLAQPKKRGRKLKSLLASTSNNNLPVIVIPSLSENKPRKRGRPPLLSHSTLPSRSEEKSVLNSLMKTQSMSTNIVSTLGALHSNFNKANNNSLPHPNWPNFASASPLYFSSNADENISNPTVKENLESVSCASEEESNIEDDCDDDSDSLENDEKCSSEKKNENLNETFNEEELRKPLKFGWRRQTLVKCFGKSGVKGEVIYYSPCGRKLKNYSDVVRYLVKKNISIIKKDNFSFNSKPVIGEYIEHCPNKGSNYLLLSESDVISRIEEIKKRKRLFQDIKEESDESESKKRTMYGDIENNIKIDNKVDKNLNDDTLVTIEDIEIIRDDAFRKYHEKDNKRFTEIFKESDLNKRKNIQLMAEMERERRKQHMILVRALEAHKRQEEREKKKEEMLAEKRAIQDRKFQKRKLELEIIRELKKPVEDMILKDSLPLPTLNRIPGLKLPSEVLGNLLMAYEFLNNFGEALGFDMENLPTLNTLQSALLNLDEGSEEEFLTIINHLLVCAIDDPGTPCNVTTVMGQKLKDAPITNFNLSEILKLYFQSFLNQYKEELNPERAEARMYRVLKTGRPFLSLNATHKAEIFCFLCNELTCNQAVVKQIEENLESVTNLRKEKWYLGCELRKYKAIKLRREKSNEEAGEEMKKLDKTDIEASLFEESGESEAEENIIITVNETEEEASITNDELSKKLEKLTKQCTQINNKLNKALNGFRVLCLGLDRYRRRYWVLPACGGIFVEGMESGEPEELKNNIQNEEENEEEEEDEEEEEEVEEENGAEEEDEVAIEEEKNKLENESEKSKKDSNSIENEKTNVKKVTVEDIKDEKNIEISQVDDDNICEVNEDVKNKPSFNPAKLESDDIIITPCEASSVLKKKEEIKCEMEIELKPTAVEKQNSKFSSNVSNSNVSLDSPWLSPIIASVLAGSMMFGNNASNSSNSALSTNGIASQPPYSFQEIDSSNLTTKTQNSQRPWFSLLPRMPCKEDTILLDASSQSAISNLNLNEEQAKFHTSQESETNAQSLKLSSMMNGLPSNLFMHAFLYPHIFGSFFQSNRSGSRLSSEDLTSQLLSSNLFKQASSCSLSENLINNLGQTQTQLSNSLNKTEVEGTIASNLNLTGIEFEVDPALKQKLKEHKAKQFKKTKKIPQEYQRGWWRLSDSGQIRSLIESLNEKGIRERNLQKHLNKYFNYISTKCKCNTVDFDISNLDRKISQECLNGAPHSISEKNWSKEVALRLDIVVLEQIEALEEKVANSSMQIRGWRPLPKITSDSKFTLSSCYELSGDNLDSEANKKEEVCKSSKNSKYLNPVVVGRERILAAEAVIERRYLKPPLGFKSNTMIISSAFSGGSDEFADNAADENAPSGLLRWREAVRECESGSQLALLLHFLESCIAWDKSIMRASCQFCGSGENEAQLLLCDGCDRGYHMYCFKPKMDSVPDGDWFCFECQNKNTIDKVCIVCGKKGKLINCDTCPKVFHPNCLDPPVTKPPKGKWSCNMCNRKPKKNKQARKNKSSGSMIEEKITKQNLVINQPPPPPETNIHKRNTSRSKKETKTEDVCLKDAPKKEKKSKEMKELAPCELLLNAIETHDDSWPFLSPVNTKQFPTYKKIIKKPMDFVSIRQKLETGGYKNDSEFICDCRLIFDNCETFNEDESPVGQAGHNLRKFMEKKWKEFNDK